MVLRGSNIKPEESLRELQAAIKVAENALESTNIQIDEARQDAYEQLADEDVDQMTSVELRQMVNSLRTRVAQLEQQSQEDTRRVEERYAQLSKTVQQLGAGGIAGATARSFVAPIDRVKILMQTSYLTGNEAKYRSIGQTLRSIISDEGFKALWRGNLTNCVRVVPHTAVQFVSYEKYKPLFQSKEKDSKLTIPQRLMAGALSGMTAASFTHPMDVVRIRLQTQPELKGAVDAIKSVYQENGMRTFYKGYTPAMLSLSPFIAINFATFDTLKSAWYGDIVLTKKELQQRNPGVILLLGASAGIIAQTFCYPLDTVRRRMQLKGTTYSSTPNAFYTIAATEGFKGFYKGMAANALKVVPNNALRFAVYEFLKSYIGDGETHKTTAPWRQAAESAKGTSTSLMTETGGSATRVMAASHGGDRNSAN